MLSVKNSTILHIVNMTSYDLVIKLIQDSYNTAVKLSFPYILITLLINFSSSIIARLIPQIQIFFVIMPLQIIIGIGLLFISISTIILFYVEQYSNFLGNLI